LLYVFLIFRYIILLSMKKKYISLLAPLVSTALGALFFFTPLDNKVFDIFLRAVPSLSENEKVLLITVDDTAIEQVGLFPWPRDIIADAIIFLKEMGARQVVFDLSYLDPSPVAVDPAYVRQDLPRYLDDGFARINEAAAQIMDGFASGQLKSRDAAELKGGFFGLSGEVREALGVNVDYVVRDVDAYFARALKFFGDAYLTLTMVTPENLLPGQTTFDMSLYNIPLLHAQALQNIRDTGDTRTPRMPGVIPAISVLLRQAKRAGFVNALPDPDGLFRRVHLLMKYDGLYYPQLALASLLDLFGNPAVEVDNQFITLKDADTEKGRRDIRIPRAEDGSVLLKWPKKPFSLYNTMSLWDLIGYTRLEKAFAGNLAIMEDSGFFAYWDGGENPWARYTGANTLRDLLAEGSPQEGLNFAAYLEYRGTYLEAARLFLDGPYEQNILTDVGADESLREFVKDTFAKTRRIYRDLIDIRARVAARVKDTISIVGVNATSMTDESLTTFQERYPNVGTYAVVENMILSQEFLDEAPRSVSLLIALALCLALAYITSRFREATGKSLTTGVFAMLITISFFLVFFIMTRRYLGLVTPFAAVTLTFLSLSAINFLTTMREKQFIRRALSTYTSKEVADVLIKDPSLFTLGGARRSMTAIFTDIRSFSTITEALRDPETGDIDAQRLVSLLNVYLTRMSDIILNNRGTIDKYEGDAIIAFFGAPIYMEEHALLACRSAIAMKKAEVDFNREAREKKLIDEAVLEALLKKGILKDIRDAVPIRTRIGVNTGSMVVGNMGTQSKFNYTIIGNAVNLTARLEGVNKLYGTQILASEETVQATRGEILTRKLDRVRVVGVNNPVQLYELLDTRQDAAPETLNLIRLWEEAHGMYMERGFAEAAKIFRTLVEDAGDNAAGRYLERCEAYVKAPPAPGWDGVVNLTEK
jgi:adenylate cyclase